MPSRSSKKPVLQPIILLEIQSGRVRGSLVSPTPTGSFDITAHHSVSIIQRPGSSGAHLSDKVMDAVQTTLGSLSPHKVPAIHCVLSSPWVITQPHDIGLDFGVETLVTKRLIESLAAKIDHSHDMPVAKELHIQGKLQTIETSIYGVRLNGYPVTNWESQHAYRVDVGCIVSRASAAFISRLEKLCRTYTTAGDLIFHSALALQYAAHAGGLGTLQTSHINVHIHDELTDLLSQNKKGEVYISSFPEIGRAHV